MNQWMLLSGMAISIFISTNLDDLFLLIALGTHRAYRFKHIVMGQIVGMALIIFASALGAWITFSVPPYFLRLLGLAPLVIGIKKLFQSKESEEDQVLENQTRGYRKVISVTLVTLANGGDNLGVYLPLFSSRSHWEIIFFALAFLSLTLLWCVLSYFLVKHPTLQKPIRTYGHVLLPWVLIGLGLLILTGD